MDFDTGASKHEGDHNEFSAITQYQTTGFAGQTACNFVQTFTVPLRLHFSFYLKKRKNGVYSIAV